VREETGIEATNPHFISLTIDGFPDSRDVFRTTFVRVDAAGADPTARGPEKTRYWQWFHWHELPRPLFAPVASLVASGYRPTAVAR